MTAISNDIEDCKKSDPESSELKMVNFCQPAQAFYSIFNCVDPDPYSKYKS